MNLKELSELNILYKNNWQHFLCPEMEFQTMFSKMLYGSFSHINIINLNLKLLKIMNKHKYMNFGYFFNFT